MKNLKKDAKLLAMGTENKVIIKCVNQICKCKTAKYWYIIMY